MQPLCALPRLCEISDFCKCIHTRFFLFLFHSFGSFGNEHAITPKAVRDIWLLRIRVYTFFWFQFCSVPSFRNEDPISVQGIGLWRIHVWTVFKNKIPMCREIMFREIAITRQWNILTAENLCIPFIWFCFIFTQFRRWACDYAQSASCLSWMYALFFFNSRMHDFFCFVFCTQFWKRVCNYSQGSAWHLEHAHVEKSDSATLGFRWSSNGKQKWLMSWLIHMCDMSYWHTYVEKSI